MAVQQLSKKQAENEELELQRDKIRNMMEGFLKPFFPPKIPTGGFPKARRKKFAAKEVNKAMGGEVDIDMTTEMDV